MCGIAGFRSAADDALKASVLSSSLRHRGPDGSSWGTYAGHVLVQTRLAIVDLSDRVKYPLGNEAENVWLTFNGEIYGFAELRRQLTRLGHYFRTRCDAEVVVHAFEEWDVEAFARLNGMFALAIVDERDGRVILARDRFGIKPLAHTTTDRFAWASDAMALVKAGLSRGAVDPEAIAEYAALHYVAPPRTGIADVTQLPPGVALIQDRDGRRSTATFAGVHRPSGNATASDPVAAVDAAMRSAVERQLIADVEVGVLLSSGIDSALLLSYALEAGARPRAFTLAFHGAGDYDETGPAANLASAHRIPHVVETFSSGFAEAVDGVSQAFDQPFADSSAVAALQLARLARTGVKVVLSGTGGDELFAGYYRLRAHRLRQPLALANRLMPKDSNGGSKGFERRSSAAQRFGYLRRLVSAENADSVSQYMSLVGNATSSQGLAAINLPVDLTNVRAQIAERLMGSATGGSQLRQLMTFERSAYLPGDVLAKDDRATMSVGLEARVPFLDDEVAEAAAALSDHELSSLLSGKRVLRSLARLRVSGAVSRSAKRGFAVPVDDLLRGAWKAEAAGWLGAASSELVDVRRLRDQVLSGSFAAPDVWALSCLVGWERQLRRAARTASAQSS